MTAQRQAYLTPQEYLRRERAGDVKHEYVDGRIYELAGASERHNLIAGNTLASLHAQVRRRPCRVYPSDMRVQGRRTGLYTYPDITVVCGEPQFADEQRDTLLNPTVIVEVLSPATERYDRGQKCRQIESLQEYVLIFQETCRVELYGRQPGGQWLLSEETAVEAEIHLPSVACTLALADLYEKVEMPADEQL